MATIRNIALVAHDNRKQELVSWLLHNLNTLSDCHFITTGTTGRLLSSKTKLKIERVNSGPLGGDQQIGAKISEQKVDLLIFFWDPLEPMSHDPDIKALLRVATLWNIPIACNRSTADFIINSPLMKEYDRDIPNFDSYQERVI